MDEEIKKNLFQIFGNMQRVGENGVIKQHGIGLGLSICKELVEFMGGQITCESTFGQGTKMEFTIQVICDKCQNQISITMNDEDDLKEEL